jgi:hypothetical protein
MMTHGGDATCDLPPGRWEVALATQSETRFPDPSEGNTIEFQLDADGTVTGFILEQGGRLTTATRVR